MKVLAEALFKPVSLALGLHGRSQGQFATLLLLPPTKGHPQAEP